MNLSVLPAHRKNCQTENALIKSSIHKNLFVRLVVAAALISLVFGTIVFYFEFQRLGQQVNKRADEIATNFNNEVKYLLDRPLPTLKAELHNRLKVLFSIGRLHLGMGKVIYAGIYTPAGDPVAIEKDQTISYISAVATLMTSRLGSLQSALKKVYEFKTIQDTPHILLTFPLTNGRGKKVAVLSGVFAVSQTARNGVLWGIAKTILQTIGVVVCTTLILYPLILTLINRLSRLAANLLDANIETLQVLGCAIAKRDCNTDIHNYRVTIYSVRIAEAIHLENTLIRSLIKGACLHDIGKIGITDNILLKRGKLTTEEFEIMKLHVTYGVDIVERSDWLIDAVDVVESHHEKFTGGGYPNGLKENAIPLNARIFAIADVFDALTSERPYKEPFPFEKAMEIMNEGRGNHFDPVVFDTFSGLAKSLYNEIAACSNESLRENLEIITRKYFSEEIYK